MTARRRWVAGAAGIASLLLGLIGCDGPTRDCAVRPGDPRYAVVLSDYRSTAIGLLDGEGSVLTECWIDSGSRSPGLVAALSGDVVLATDQPSGALAVLDRFGTDVYSRVDLSTPQVLGQVRLQDPAVSGAFSSNPHDAIIAGPRSVWVSRFAGSADPDAPPLARGSDLLEIDVETFQRTGRRISLEALIEDVTVATDDGPAVKAAFPRASRMVRVGDTVVVGLARLTLEFDAAAPGAVAVVDLESGAVRRHALGSGVLNCGRVVPVPGAADLVAVGCIGFSIPFGDEARIRATSGLFVLRVTSDAVTTVFAWRPGDDPSRPLSVAELVAIDERTLLAVDFGQPGPDRLFTIDVEDGSTALVHESRSAFAIGAAAYAFEQGELLVPDAAVGIRRFRRTPDGGFVLVDTIPLDGGGIGLPPRAVHRLP